MKTLTAILLAVPLLLSLFVSCARKEQAREDLSNAVSPEDSTATLARKRLLELVGTWKTIENSFDNPGPGFAGTFIGSAAANSNALLTKYQQGSGASYYEANALWAYSESAGQVRVFEVNSLGFADTHVGSFDATGMLTIEFNDAGRDMFERRTMTWANDTLTMRAYFSIKGDATEHSFILVRQRDLP